MVINSEILITILIICFIHWFADFVCQTDWQAQNKSKDWKALLNHTTIYSLIWTASLILINGISTLVTDDGHFYLRMYWFPVITFACHTVIDYYTSRVNSKLWEDKDVHGFFVSIGFDQFLHYAQLFLTYYLLMK